MTTQEHNPKTCTEHDHANDHEHDEECTHEQEHVHGENCDHDHEEGHDGKGNKGEKKFKKAMSKMGLKPFPGINRVTIKKGKSFVISIDDPDVWKTPGAESAYIIFGKPNMDGLGGTGQSEINQFKNPVNVEGQQQKVQTTAITAEKVEQASEQVSEQGLSQDNIKMVMQYTKCTKTEAIKALRQTNDDSVNAIMKLTK